MDSLMENYLKIAAGIVKECWETPKYRFVITVPSNVFRTVVNFKTLILSVIKESQDINPMRGLNNIFLSNGSVIIFASESENKTYICDNRWEVSESIEEILASIYLTPGKLISLAECDTYTSLMKIESTASDLDWEDMIFSGIKTERINNE